MLIQDMTSDTRNMYHSQMYTCMLYIDLISLVEEAEGTHYGRRGRVPEPTARMVWYVSEYSQSRMTHPGIGVDIYPPTTLLCIVKWVKSQPRKRDINKWATFTPLFGTFALRLMYPCHYHDTRTDPVLWEGQPRGYPGRQRRRRT